jgi:fluoride exporter
MIKNLLLVGLGGGIGSMLRYATGLLINSKYFHFPYATITVNIIGSFIIGVFLAMSIKGNGLTDQWKLFLATGICGGFTTFSAFSIENMELLQSGKIGMAAFYIILSIVLGIGAAFLGYYLVRET